MECCLADVTALLKLPANPSIARAPRQVLLVGVILLLYFRRVQAKPTAPNPTQRHKFAPALVVEKRHDQVMDLFVDLI